PERPVAGRVALLAARPGRRRARARLGRLDDRRADPAAIAAPVEVDRDLAAGGPGDRVAQVARARRRLAVEGDDDVAAADPRAVGRAAADDVGDEDPAGRRQAEGAGEVA